MALSELMTVRACALADPGVRIASMGYPDMIARPEVLVTALWQKGLEPEHIAVREDSAVICYRHGKATRPIPDAHAFFALFGAHLDVFDIVAERGCEILCDLNYPFPPEHAGKYDLVLDVGTLEHCFNIGQAARNMAALLKVGGVIFHQNPFNVGNHGFYNLNPTWYTDWYGQGSFTLLQCVICDEKSVWTTPPTQRFKFAEPGIAEDCGIFAMARKDSDAELGWPMQTKYKVMAQAKAA